MDYNKYNIVDIVTDCDLQCYSIQFNKDGVEAMRNDDPSVCSDDAEKMWMKICTSAVNMRDGVLGCEFNFANEDRSCSVTAFVFDNEEISSDDISWMYEDLGKVTKQEYNDCTSHNIFGNGRKVYGLFPRTRHLSLDMWITMGMLRTGIACDETRQNVCDAYDTFVDSGMIVQAFFKEGLNSSGIGAGRKDYGTVLISTLGKMSLKLRNILTVFDDLEVIEVTEKSLKEDAAPVLQIQKGMVQLSCIAYFGAEGKKSLINDEYHVYTEAEDTDKDEQESDNKGNLIRTMAVEGVDWKPGDEDVLDLIEEKTDASDDDCLNDYYDDDDEEGYLKINDLHLSYKTTDILTRFGITNLHQLSLLSDDDFWIIDGMDVDCFVEIKAILLNLEKNSERREENQEKQGTSEKETVDYLKLLDDLVGLENVKKQVRDIVAYAKMKKDLPDNVKAPIVLNMQFVGNPGTAKTTVARILAGVLYQIGIIRDKKLVEVGRADLVGQYVGHTAKKVRDLFAKSSGRMIFIDEAYSLLDNWDNEYGDEAINTIVQEMENRRDKVVVVFAGYPDRMKDFIERNPGLRSRVPFKVSFKDYTVDELMEITRLEAEKRGFSISTDAFQGLGIYYETVMGDPDMGNGRLARNLVEAAILNYCSRLYQDEENGEKNFVLLGEDFESAENCQESKNTRAIGFRVN